MLDWLNSFGDYGEYTWVFTLIDIGMALISLVGGYFSVIYVRKRNPFLIYVMFYLFSLFFCVGILMRTIEYVYLGSAPLENVHETSDNYVRAIFNTLKSIVNVQDEFLLVLIVSVILVVPQTISYLLAGFFGCAEPPRFIANFTKYSILSIAKTMICWDGFVLGYYLLHIPYVAPPTSGKELISGWFTDKDWYIGYVSAFSMPFVYLVPTPMFADVLMLGGNSANESKMHKFMTRYNKRQKN